MNTKLNSPDEIITLNFKKYSLWADLKVNRWLLVALLLGAANIFLFHCKLPAAGYYQEWPATVRAAIETFPMAVSLLWMRDVARWIRGMDELHRRIMLETSLFAVVGTLFFLTIWNHLQNLGILKAIFQPGAQPAGHWNWRHLANLDFSYFPLMAGLLWSFYFLGFNLVNRRYK